MAKYIALVGNPNTGKTTFLNNATGANCHVGNWHGVTIEPISYKVNDNLSLVDLAGTYSLCPYTLEESITDNFILQYNLPIYNICEQNNLARNLMLTLQLLELKCDVTLVVNNFGETENFDIDKLSQIIKMPIYVIDFFDKKQVVNTFQGGTKNNIDNLTLDYLDKVPFKEIKSILSKFNVKLSNLQSNKIKQKQKKPFLKKIFKENYRGDKLERTATDKCSVCSHKSDCAKRHFSSTMKGLKRNDKSFIDAFVAMRIIEGDENYIQLYDLDDLAKRQIKSLVNDKTSEYLYELRFNKIENILKLCNYNRILKKQKKSNIEKADNEKQYNTKTDKNVENALVESGQAISNNLPIRNKKDSYISRKDTHKRSFLFKKKFNKNKQLTFKGYYLDKILLNKYLALPIFLFIILFIFFITFGSLGAFLSDSLEYLIVDLIGTPILNLLDTIGVEFIYSLFKDGILGGVGSIVSFLPQVLLLFLFLTILEESGYMARLAYLLEGICNKVGLSGKSVFTFLMGYGCTATAILTAENLESKNAKIKTVLTTPFMACSAKLPVFAVLGGAFFGASNVFVIFALYIFSAVIGIVVVNILDKTILPNKDSSFLLEFPPYRVPKMKILLKSVGKNTGQFLSRVANYILIFSILIWFLQSFTFTLSYVDNLSEKSMLQTIAEFIAPVFTPLGFGEWGAVSALLAGLVAKELIVSSIGIINNVGAGSVDLVGTSIIATTSAVYFSPASVLSFLTFCLLYTPCVATISAMHSQIGTKWTVFSVVMQLVVAYIGSYVIYKVALLFEYFKPVTAIFIVIVISLLCISAVKLIKVIYDRKICPYKK